MPAAADPRKFSGGISPFSARKQWIIVTIALFIAAVVYVRNPGSAYAANECGADAAGATVLNCAAATYASGITYTNSDGLTVNLTNPATAIGNPGVSSNGSAANTNAITVNGTSFATINVTSNSSFGVSAQNSGDGNTTVNLVSGAITTSGTSAYATMSRINKATSASNANIAISGGSLTTSGSNSHGVFGLNTGTGGVSVSMSGGTVNTSGTNAFGILSQINNGASTGAASLSLSGGSILTTGSGAKGLQNAQQGLGSSILTMSGGSISTSNINAVGVYHNVTLSGNTAVHTTTISGGTINTTGSGSNGVFTISSGSVGSLTTNINGGTISTAASSTHGAVTQINNAASTSNLNVSMTNGSISTSGTFAYGLNNLNAGLGTLNMAMSGGTITTTAASANGISSTNSNASNASNVSTNLSGGTITAAGIGIATSTSGTGSLLTTISGGTVSSSGGNGVNSAINNASGFGNNSFLMTGGSVSTSANSANSLSVTSGNLGNIDLTIANGSVSASGLGSIGAFAYNGGSLHSGTTSLTLNNGSVTSSNGTGLYAQNSANGHVNLAINGGAITTGGNTNHFGALAVTYNTTSTGTISASMTGGTMVANGDNNGGILANSYGLGAVNATLSGGQINTTGTSTYGLRSFVKNTASLAAATSTMTGGTITTSGSGSAGLRAENDGLGIATVAINTGTNVSAINTGCAICVSNNGAMALIRNAANTSAATIDFSGNNLTLSTQGAGSFGLYAQNAGFGNTAITIASGAVSTSGTEAYGAFSQISNSLSSASTSFSSTGGTITTAGAGADAIRLQNAGTGAMITNIGSGTITSGTGNAAAIHTVGSGSASITIGAGATINGSASGIAIRDGDRMTDLDNNSYRDDDNDNNGFLDVSAGGDNTATALPTGTGDGIDETYNGGNATVSTAGTVTGDAILGLGNDTFTLRGGIYTGSIYGDDRGIAASDDGRVNHEGDDGFNWIDGTWFGGFYGQDGSDTAVVSASGYDGTQILNGGDDATSADGMIDRVTLSSVTASTIGSRLANWEEVNLVNSKISVDSLVTEKLNVCAGETTLLGESDVQNIYGCKLNDTLTLSDDTLISGSVEGSGGADSLTILGNATIRGGLYGGGQGQDKSDATDAADTIFVDTTGHIGLVDSGAGDDSVSLQNGTVDADVNAQDGADAIEVNGNTLVQGNVIAGNGDDLIGILGQASVAGKVMGDNADESAQADGNDQIWIETTGHVGSVISNGGDDTLSLKTGSIDVEVNSGSGQDVIGLLGAKVGTDISAGSGDDTFFWTDGTLKGGFYGENGSDTAIVTAMTFDGSQQLNGGDGTSSDDGMIDTLTLSDAMTKTYGGNLQDWETINIDHTSLNFADTALTVGNTTGLGLFLTNGSTINIGNTFSLSGNLSVDTSSQYRLFGGGSGVYFIGGVVMNAGLIQMYDATPGDQLVINGDYSGTGALALDVDLGQVLSDQVTINGNATGSTSLAFNFTGDGAVGKKQRIVHVYGNSSSDAFRMSGRIAKGAYFYDLSNIGSDWYLSPVATPAAAVYESYVQNLSMINSVSGLQQRFGNRYWDQDVQDERVEVDSEQDLSFGTPLSKQNQAIWLRMEGSDAQLSAATSSTGAMSSTRTWKLRGGLDGPIDETASGTLIAGLNAFFATSMTDVSYGLGNGFINSTGFGAGISATWYGADGFYVDGQAQLGWTESTLDSAYFGTLADKNNGFAIDVSTEIGQRLAISGNQSMTPQAQLTYSSLAFDGFAGTAGGIVKIDNGESLKLRMGISLDHEASTTAANGSPQRSHFFGFGNVYHEFSAPRSVRLSGATLANDWDDWTAEIGLGTSMNWDDDHYSVFSELSVNSNSTDFTDSFSAKANAGMKVRF